MATVQTPFIVRILIKDIQDGGPDPNFNPRLVDVISNAKKSGFSKSSIEAAIAKGQGKSSTGLPLEPITIEAVLPHKVGAVIECLTESKARTLQDVRATITKRGGTIKATKFLFQKKGRNVFQKADGIGTDTVLEQAIDAGALEVDLDEEGRLVVETEPDRGTLGNVARAIQESFQLQLESSDIIYDPVPETTVDLDESEYSIVESLVDMIQEDSSVQDVFLNLRASR
ncbi:MAG: hypothetical protein Q9227_008230 [Pyrenula ochraceoflavens]